MVEDIAVLLYKAALRFFVMSSLVADGLYTPGLEVELRMVEIEYEYEYGHGLEGYIGIKTNDTMFHRRRL